MTEQLKYKSEGSGGPSVLSAGLGAWLPIETAPKDRNILLWGQYWSDEQGLMPTPLFGAWNGRTGRWECAWMYWFGVRPTHWMEIPKAPNATKLTGRGTEND